MGSSGPDGDFGYGGHCLPKDLSAIVIHLKHMVLLEAVEQVNDHKFVKIEIGNIWLVEAVLEEEDLMGEKEEHH